MKKLMKLLTIALVLITNVMLSQTAPSCPTNSILAHNGSSINNHSLPNGPLNTILNNMPAGSGGLAVGPAFLFPAPNPTWWTTAGGTYWYYNNGGTWSNTGHTVGSAAAVNIGGGATKIYNLVGASGQIYVYNGLANGTLLTTLVPAFGGAGPYDVVCDMADNFFILRASNPQGIYCYNPAGVLTCSWSVTGMIQQTAGGGFAILTTANPLIHRMYYNSNGTDYIGNMIPGNSIIASTVQALPGGSDYACCALPIPIGLIVAPLGGTLTCNLPQIPLVAQVLGNASLSWLGGYGTPTTTPVTPTCGGITWSGPGIVSGQGTPTINVNVPGVYSYTINGCNGCPGYSITASYTVVGMPGVINPVITAPLCFTGLNTMSVSPNTNTSTVLWSGPGIVGPNNTFTISFNQPGVYTTTITGGACSGTASILVSPSPTINIVSSSNGICANNYGGSLNSVTFTANGATNYTWSATGLVNTTSNTLSPITYTPMTGASVGSVTVIGSNGTCTSSATYTIAINPNPTITVSSGSICPGFGASLTANGAATYTWVGSNLSNTNISNPIATPLVTSNYTVSGTNAFGCINSNTTSVTVYPSPTITTTSATLCVGGSGVITAGGANTYVWSPPTGLSNPNISNPTANPVVTTIYTVVGTSVNGCTSTNTSTVTVNPLPILSTISATTCANVNTTISASGASAYSWSNGGLTPSIIVAPAVNTTYTVIGTSVAGCTSSATASVTISPPLVVNLTSNGPLCTGNTLSLAANIGTIWNWSGPNSFTSNVQNPLVLNVPVANSGIYTVNVTNAFGCTGVGTINVIVNPLPNITSSNNSAICTNQTLNLSSNGGLSYSWSGPNGFISNQQNPTIGIATTIMSGVYTVTSIDINGCSNTSTTSVTINPLPIVSAIGSTVCSGANVTLSSNGGVTYSWTGPNGFISNQQNPILPNGSVLMSGGYVVTVTDANGCINSTMANVSVTPPYTINITNNSPICQGYTLNLSAPLGYGYNWTGPNGFFSSLSSPYIDNAQPNASGVYSLVVTDANGCTSSAVTIATVNPNPILSISATSDKVCVPACITFTINSTNTISSISWFFMNGGVSGNNISTQCFNRGGVYTSTATVTDNNGCQSVVSNSIEVYPKPIADFVFNPIKPIEGNEVSFTDASFGTNISQWYWFFNSQNINSILQNPYYTYMEAGSYPITLIVKSDKGCSDTLTKVIIVGEDYGIYVPNTFTPNGDGFNDTFSAKGYGIVKFEMNIFDRWGEKLFSTNDMRNAWDGTIKGKLCKDDVYVWKINLTNVFGKSHELTGHVTLMK